MSDLSWNKRQSQCLFGSIMIAFNAQNQASLIPSPRCALLAPARTCQLVLAGLCWDLILVIGLGARNGSERQFREEGGKKPFFSSTASLPVKPEGV